MSNQKSQDDHTRWGSEGNTFKMLSGTLNVIYTHETLKAFLAGIISFGRVILMACEPVSVSLLPITLTVFSKFALYFGFWHLPHSIFSVSSRPPVIPSLPPDICHFQSLGKWIKSPIILLNFGTSSNQPIIMLAVCILIAVSD